MTYYETLRHKAELCRLAAGRTNGSMRKIWLEKSNKLEEQAANLPLVKAVEITK